jgi:chloramphenicol O-acetyltransferase type A
MKSISKYKVNAAGWKREVHYNFFKGFAQPFFGISTDIDATEAYDYCKQQSQSFFLFYLHRSLLAANLVPELRQRIEEDEVYEYATISASVTVLRPDDTFGFAYMDHYDEFEQFAPPARTAVDYEKTRDRLQLRDGFNSLIHYSILKDIRFTSMQHAQPLTGDDSVPKIVFGQFYRRDDRVWLPTAIHAHHALCDGRHIGRFVHYFQEQINRVPADSIKA